MSFLLLQYLRSPASNLGDSAARKMLDSDQKNDNDNKLKMYNCGYVLYQFGLFVFQLSAFF